MAMRATTLCQGCWEQMHMPIAIRGPFSPPFRALGIKRSRMHPNLCTVCESMFTRVKKQKQIQIDTSILFADLRGYTRLSEQLDTARMNQLLHTFYDRCSEAIWEHDGIVNKFIGDAVLAIFNFPLERKDHATRAVKAAVHLQRACHQLKEEIGIEENAVGVGVGIHTGRASMGEVGNAYKDFTVIGPVVNLASRLQTHARPGEIVISAEVYERARNELPDLPLRQVGLKGIEVPVQHVVIGTDAQQKLAHVPVTA